MRITRLLLLFTAMTLSLGEVGVAIEVDKRHPSARKEEPTAKEIADEREWMATDKGSVIALEKYLAKRPRGSRFKEATMFLTLAKRLEGIIAGTIKPAVVIPFEDYGDDWNPRPGKTASAFSYNRTLRVGEHLGGFWTYDSPDFESRSSFSPGKFADLAFSRWPSNARAGHGSVIAFDTAGDECPLRDRPIIVTAKKNVVYFGVVDKVGFVHIAGEGRVIFKDGKVVNYR